MTDLIFIIGLVVYLYWQIFGGGGPKPRNPTNFNYKKDPPK